MAQLGQDIINAYKPYRNHNANWKTVTISKQKFEIPDRYEIIDVSKIFIQFSRSRCIWNRCRCQGQIMQNLRQVISSH